MGTPSASDVKSLTGSKLSDPVVDAIIADAALLAADCLSGVSDALETTVLKWLAAHLVASTSESGSLTTKKLGDGSRSYASAQLGSGLMGTSYGQQAIALLPCLSTVGGYTASVEVI